MEETTKYLIEKLREYIVENNLNTSIYQCNCGYGQGHQIVYCPKCGTKMKYLKNISFLELYKINKKCIDWSSRIRFDFGDKYSNEISKLFGSSFVNEENWHFLWDNLYENK